MTCTFCNTVSSSKAFCCTNCGKLLPISNLNFFQLFGIDNLEEISLNSLNNKLFELQRKFHPDQFVRKDKFEQELAAEHSVKINEAYQTLKDPIKYIEYFLMINNYDLIKQKNVVPQEYILSMYEYAETLSDTTNKAEAEQILEHLRSAQKLLISETINEIKSSNFDNALAYLAKIKYLNSIIKK